MLFFWLFRCFLSLFRYFPLLIRCFFWRRFCSFPRLEAQLENPKFEVYRYIMIIYIYKQISYFLQVISASSLTFHDACFDNFWHNGFMPFLKNKRKENKTKQKPSLAKTMTWLNQDPSTKAHGHRHGHQQPTSGSKPASPTIRVRRFLCNRIGGRTGGWTVGRTGGRSGYTLLIRGRDLHGSVENRKLAHTICAKRGGPAGLHRGAVGHIHIRGAILQHPGIT